MVTLRPRKDKNASYSSPRKEITHLIVTKPFRFLSIPSELRIRVYRWVLVYGRTGPIVSATTIGARAFNSRAMQKHRIDNNIFLVNRQISAEALNVFLTDNCFLIRSSIPRHLTDLIEPPILRRIRALRIEYKENGRKEGSVHYLLWHMLERLVYQSLDSLVLSWIGRTDIRSLEIFISTYALGLPLNKDSPNLEMLDPLRDLKAIRTAKLTIGGLETLSAKGIDWALKKMAVVKEIEASMSAPMTAKLIKLAQDLRGLRGEKPLTQEKKLEAQNEKSAKRKREDSLDLDEDGEDKNDAQPLAKKQKSGDCRFEETSDEGRFF